MLGVRDFDIIPAPSEAEFPRGLFPGDAAVAVAREKAKYAAARAPEASLVIAADTVVSLDGAILEKPEDEAQARRMLAALSGRKHTVYSGLVLLYKGEEKSAYEATDVYFRPLGADELEAYVATGEPMDKAGAYGAQGVASIFIERIDGDFFNVVGLPLCTLSKLIKEYGFGVIS
jgi:septum formation protein